MIVLSPNQEQYNDLNGYKFNSSILQFTKDYSDRWVVGLEVLDYPNFAAINDKLYELERIEYTPFPPEPEE
jgi:hypothetical protein